MARRKALTTAADLRKQLAERRKRAPIVGASVGNWMSTRGGKLTYKGEVLETPIDVIILSYGQDFQWYDTPFDPDNQAPPACAAVGIVPVTELQPAADSPKRQADSCIECPLFEWGSDARGGRGKECNTYYRVALVAADDPGGDIAMVRIAPSGYQGFEAFINRLASKTDEEADPAGWLCHLDFTPGLDYPVIQFAEQELLEDSEVIETVVGRLVEADQMVEQPYDFSQYEEPAPKAPRRAKKKVGKKKAAARGRR